MTADRFGNPTGAFCSTAPALHRHRGAAALSNQRVVSVWADDTVDLKPGAIA
jgi:hypothetical protein